MIWGGILKRIISIVLTFTILLLSVADGVISYASNVADDSLNDFATELSKLIRDHANCCASGDLDSDDYQFDFPLYYNPIVNEYFTEKPENNEDYIDISKELASINKTAEDFQTNRLIVKSSKSINYCGAIDVVSGYKDLYILQYESIADTIMAYKYYMGNKNIEYVEPDYYASSEVDLPEIPDNVGDATDVDTWFTSENGFDDLKSELAQNVLEEILVAVIDSGVDTDHEHLAGRLIESNVNLSDSGMENSCEDDYGHGTHVAGIVVTNTLENVKIKPYKVLNDRGNGSISQIVVAVDMAVEDGADVINLSITSKGESQTLTDSVDAATNKDVSVIVAAGNDKADLSKTYYSPACIESAITVSATARDSRLASYSNYNGTIDIAAHGDDIRSSYLNNRYILLNGTSMAAPQVAAGFAIVKSVYPELTSAEVEEKIKEYAIIMEEEEGCNYFGAGMLYLKYILSEIPRTANPVFSVESCEFSNSFNVTITCPERTATILYVMYSGESIEDLEDIEGIGYLNGTEYKEPITVSIDTKIAAVAIIKGKLFSEVVVHSYDRTNITEEDNYDIDKNGMITGYFGKETDIVVPESIRGIAVTGIGIGAFEDNTKVHSVTLPAAATKINNDAFKNCTNLYSVKGDGLVEVGANAFELSTITEFPFEQIVTFGNYSFTGCNNLTNVDISNAEYIGKSVFENAYGLCDLSNDKLTTFGANAFAGSSVKSITLNKITTIPKNAFEGCSALTTVTAQSATVVSNSAFLSCSALENLDMPSLKTVNAYAFKNTGFSKFYSDSIIEIGNYAFQECKKLVGVSLPNLTKAGNSAFITCSNLKFVNLPKVTEVSMGMFKECSSLKSLWLPSVTKTSALAFTDSAIEYLQLDKVQKIVALPDTLLALVVPTSFSSVTASVPETEFKVYGYKDTYAETFALENGKEFIEVPAIVATLPETFDVNDKYIYAYSFGFNCTYQWYENDCVSNEGGTIIEGATNFWYEPNKEDEAVAYYCIITSDDGTNYRSIVSAPITNSPYLRNADLSNYYTVIEETQNIDRELYTDESLSVIDELTSVDVSEFSLADQDKLDSLVQSIKDAVSSLVYDYELGDINDDGKVSLIDVRLALKTISGSDTLDRLQTLAADVNQDDKISLIDVRMILKIIAGELVFEEE